MTTLWERLQILIDRGSAGRNEALRMIKQGMTDSDIDQVLGHFASGQMLPDTTPTNRNLNRETERRNYQRVMTPRPEYIWSFEKGETT